MENSLDSQFVLGLWKNADPNHFVEFRFLYYETSTSHATVPGPSAFIRVGELLSGDVDEFLLKMRKFGIEKGLNVHPGINPRFRQGGTNEDVSKFVALYVDIDILKQQLSRTAIDDKLKWMAENGMEPSAVLETGNGLHVYWFLETPCTREAALPVMKALQEFLDGDSIAEPCRVMRLGGTQNLKDRNNPKECRTIQGGWGRHDLSAFGELVEEYGPEEEEEEEEEDRPSRFPSAFGPGELEKLQEGVPEGDRHSTAMRLAGHWLGKGLSFDDTWTRIEQWNEKNHPPATPEGMKALRKNVQRLAKKDAKKPKKKNRIGFAGRKFIPRQMAEHILKAQNLLSTPKTNSGRGGEICYIYRDGTFVPEGADFVAEETDRILAQYSESKPSRIAEVLAMVKIMQAKDHSLMNRHAHDLINVKNGMLEWKTGNVQPHSPDHYCTYQINASHDPLARSDTLDEFFESVFNEDSIDLVEEFIGYLLIPSSRFQKCFIAIGPGGNGKSTFLTILELFLGPGTVAFESLHELEENIFTRANLLDKLANFHHEVSSQMLESTGIFKSIVSGDTISAQLKHQNAFTFTPFSRLVFSANEFPKSHDRTEAFYQRLIFVEFPKCFRGTKEEIPDFARTMSADPRFRSALLNRAVRGLRRLMENGKFSVAESSSRLVSQYRETNASSTQAFLAEAFDFGPAHIVPRSEIYDTYNRWAKSNGMVPLGRNKFLGEVRSQPGIEEARTEPPRRERVFVGLRWKSEFDPDSIRDQIDRFGNSDRDGDDSDEF